MNFDGELISLIRRAAPTPESMAELLMILLAEFSEEQRREVLAELAESGLLGMQERHLAHGASLAAPARDDLVLEVPQETKEWVLDRVTSRLPGEDFLELRSVSLPVRDVLISMNLANRVIMVESGGQQILPSFQFNRELGDVPLPHFTVQRANRILGAGEDPWGTLAWWVSPNGWIGGETPADLIGSDEEGNLTALAESVLLSAG